MAEQNECMLSAGCLPALFRRELLGAALQEVKGVKNQEKERQRPWKMWMQPKSEARHFLETRRRDGSRRRAGLRALTPG